MRGRSRKVEREERRQEAGGRRQGAKRRRKGTPEAEGEGMVQETEADCSLA